MKKRFSLAEAKQIGDALGIDWAAFGVEQFQIGLEVELEPGARDTQTNVTDDDALITGASQKVSGLLHMPVSNGKRGR